jgi:hypothetical protein
MFQKKFVKKIETCVLCLGPFPEKYVIYDIMRKQDGPQTIKCMRFACWINKARFAHSEYELLIAFPHQQLLCKGSSVLRLYIYIYILPVLFCIIGWLLYWPMGHFFCYCYFLIGKRLHNILIAICLELYLCRTGRYCCFRRCTHIL